MARELLIQCPDGQMRTVPLTERVAVGRSSAAELCFPEDAGLSRQHFAFEPEGEGWTVQDLGSKNGTFVNQIPLKGKLLLQPGDRIAAGHLAIVYSPESVQPAQGLVMFDGGDLSISPASSTVVTSLEGALANPALAFPGAGSKAPASGAGGDGGGVSLTATAWGMTLQSVKRKGAATKRARRRKKTTS